MNFVLGARGRLGSAIVDFSSKNQLIALNRAIYSDWGSNHAADSVSRYFEPFQTQNNDEPQVIYVTSGLLDPALSREDHEIVNYILAKNVIEGATRVGFQVITFGTVMEQILGINSTNPYVASKAKLGCFVEDYASRHPLALHVQLHTLYGVGLPSPFMFVGQLLDSLIKKDYFKMTPGAQLREYHHIHDEVQAIFAIAKANISGIIALSHGEPVSLKQLASCVFEHFYCANLLQLGALPEPPRENFDVIFRRPDVLDEVSFRDTLPSLVIYIHECMNALNKEKSCQV